MSQLLFSSILLLSVSANLLIVGTIRNLRAGRAKRWAESNLNVQ